jgi:parallel beta-helix repeat protein
MKRLNIGNFLLWATAILFVALAVCFIFAGLSWATSYYVDNLVADTNVASATPDFITYNPVTFSTIGGTASVYKTVADINACTFTNSDNILFRKGQTFSGQLTSEGWVYHGHIGTPITFSSFGTGAAPIISGGNCCIRIDTSSYIVLDGLTASGSAAAWNGGFYVNACDNVTIRNCTALDSADPEADGIRILNSTNCTVDTCTVTNTGYNGIFVFGGVGHTGNIVKNCTVYDIPITGIDAVGLFGNRLNGVYIQDNECYDCKAGIYIGYVDNSEISGNNVHDNKGAGALGEPYGMGMMSCSTNLVFDNTFHDNNNKALDCYGDDGVVYGHSDGNKFYRNVFSDHTQAGAGDGMHFSSNDGLGVNNNEVYYNIMSGNLKGLSYDIEAGSTGNVAYNNTIYGNGIGLYLEHANPGVTWKNNLFSNNTTYDVSATSSSTPTHTYNSYYDSGAGNLVLWNGTTYTVANISTFEATCIKTDPLMTLPASGNFTLQGTSPCVNKGTAVGLVTDYVLATVPYGTYPDIGAYEYSASRSYYISTSTGSDSNSGLSEASPWLTIGKAYTERTYISPGDYVKLKAGEHWHEILNCHQPGSAGLPITYTSYGTGARPIITGADFFTDNTWTDDGGGVYHRTLTMADPGPMQAWYNGTPLLWAAADTTPPSGGYYFSTNVFYINAGTGAGSPPAANTVEYTFRINCAQMNDSYVTLNGLHFTKANETNILQYDHQVDYVVVNDCLSDYASKSGLLTRNDAAVNGDYWTITNSEFAWNGGPQAAVAPHGLYFQYGTGWYIANNYFHDNVTVGSLQSFGITAKDITNCIIEKNRFANQYGGAVELSQNSASVVGCSGNRISYNIATSCRRFLYSNDDGTHYNNTGNLAYNNSAYDVGYAGFDISKDGALSDLTLKNNIIRTSGTGMSIRVYYAAASLTASDYNDFGPDHADCIRYKGNLYASLAAFIAAYPAFDAHSTSADPLFVAAPTNLMLTSGSPCRNTGTDVSLTSDYVGATVPKEAVQDMGAYEYDPPVSTIGPLRIQIW